MLITYPIIGEKKIYGLRGDTLLRNAMSIVIVRGSKMPPGGHGPSQKTD